MPVGPGLHLVTARGVDAELAARRSCSCTAARLLCSCWVGLLGRRRSRLARLPRNPDDDRRVTPAPAATTRAAGTWRHGPGRGRPPRHTCRSPGPAARTAAIRVRHARPRDALDRVADNGRRGMPAKNAGGDRDPLVNCSAHRAVCGTRASTARLCWERSPAGRPSSAASTRSQASTETAMTRCRSAATTGSAIVVHRNAIRASMCGSSPVSPITDGMSSASPDAITVKGRPV